MNEVRDLQELGLSASEAALYVALLERGSASASELAELAGLARPSVYAATKSLAERGMIEAGAGYRQRFRAVPPEVALPSLIERHRERLNERERLAKELEQRLPSLGEAFGELDGQVIEIIKSPRAAADRLTRLQLEAQHTIDWLVKGPIVTNTGEDPAQANALSRGVCVRAVYEPEVLGDAQVQPYLEQWVASGEEARVARGELPIKLALIDRRVALMPLETPREVQAVTFIVIRHEALGAALQMLFDYLWHDAAPIQG